MKNLHLTVCAVIALLVSSLTAVAQNRSNTRVDTLSVMLQRANAGDDVAQNILGLWYYTGNKVDKDYEKALKWWALAAKKDNADAIGNMAMCYQLGRGAEADSALASRLYIKAFEKGNDQLLQQHIRLSEEKGNVFSSLLLFDVYSHAKGGQQRDMDKALAFLQKAAETGHTDSQVKLALQYFNMHKVEDSAKWFKALADKGQATGLYYYGYQLFRGIGIEQDKTTGIEYLKKAAVAGIINANKMLGTIYYEGDGIDADYATAVGYLKKAAASRQGESQLVLAKCYMNGKGVEKDYAIAVQWLAEAYANNQADMVVALLSDSKNAAMKTYVDGLKAYYIDVDYVAALNLFKKLEKDIPADAQMMQAICMADANNTKGNAKKAFRLMTTAAESSPAAMFALSKMYDDGIGTDKNTDKARELTITAADLGEGHAQCLAGDWYMEGKRDGMVQDMVKAVDYYLKAEKQFCLNSASAKHLAECYRLDINNLPDKNKAQLRMEALKNWQDTDHLKDMLRKL